MRKLLATFLSILMLFSLFCTMAFAAEAPKSTTSPTVVPVKGPELHLEYTEFYNNQDYYMDLVRNEDYVLYIDVGEENLETEIARLTDGATVDRWEPSLSRGTNPPSKGYNIVSEGTYHFSVDTPRSRIYSNYYFVGASSYIVSMTNTSNVTPAGGGAINAMPYSFTAGTHTTVQKFNVISLPGMVATATPFSFFCNGPTYVYGTVEKG